MDQIHFLIETSSQEGAIKRQKRVLSLIIGCILAAFATTCVGIEIGKI